MQSIGNASGNTARLSYTSTSSCDSYSAYHRSKAEDKLYYLRDILTPCEFDKEVDIVMERMARKAEEEALGTLSVEGQDVRRAKVGGGQERLSHARYQSWNHQVKEPSLVVAESNSPMLSIKSIKSVLGDGLSKQ
ncbi:hypothetical protein VE02_05776 [Pseudogymnoascus sp. 03VT05]|nr:hypothetical protein VE02_05776 [Pseudogymnoascus sp. 03VT05]